MTQAPMDGERSAMRPGEYAENALFLVWGAPPKGPRSRVLAKELGVEALHFVYPTTREGWLAAPFKYTYQAAASLLLLFRARPWLVFVQSPPGFAVLVVCGYCLLTGARYVVDAHSAAFQLPYWRHPEALYRFLARRAVVTIVTNQTFARIITGWGGRALILRDIPTAFPQEDSYPLGEGLNVAVVNTFSYDEPLEEVLQAATQLEGVRFHVTGKLNQADPVLLAQAPANVRFTGFLPDSVYYALLAASDAVMCLTTRDDTMQRGACEALSLGRPIITSDWPLLRDYFHQGTVHVPNTAAGIRDGVQTLRQHRERLQREIVALQQAQQAEWRRKRGELARLIGEGAESSPDTRVSVGGPIEVALRGKGAVGLLKRAGSIGRRYGVSPHKMGGALERFSRVLAEHGCGGTWAVTAAALERHSGLWEPYLERDVELALHGYAHVDYTRLPVEEQIERLAQARQVFADRGIPCSGVRLPYLRWNDDTTTAIRRAGLAYDGTPTLAWDPVGVQITPAYQRVLDFYGARSAQDYPSLPRLEGDLVRLPYGLPDDEALVERLELDSPEAMTAIWPAILAETHRRGELFTLGLHPERIGQCEGALAATLARAREMSPPVWVARMDQIARWWRERRDAPVSVTADCDGAYQVDAGGPEGTTLLVRGGDVLGDTQPWDGVYRRVVGARITLRAPRRPVVGVSLRSAPHLASFLRQQGYIVEPAEAGREYAVLLDRPAFNALDERPLLESLEAPGLPLVRLGRWPYGASSALCITGDIDAITLLDYGLRFVGR